MENHKLQSFKIIGLKVRTTNEAGKSAEEIPKLWAKFFSENTLESIPNKLDNTIVVMYTEYEKDFTKPYSAIIGCKVSSLSYVPLGMVGKEINENNYLKIEAEGNINKGLVFEEWKKIWASNIQRKYIADFEIYDERCKDPENAKVDIYISI